MSCEILEAAVVCSLSLSSLFVFSCFALFVQQKKTTTTYQKDESDLADSLSPTPPLFSSFFFGLFTLETLVSGQRREVELSRCVSFLLSKA